MDVLYRTAAWLGVKQSNGKIRMITTGTELSEMALNGVLTNKTII